MTEKLNRLVVQIEGDGSTDGKRIVEHAPQLRTAQQNEMLQQIFRRIELTCYPQDTYMDCQTKL